MTTYRKIAFGLVPFFALLGLLAITTQTDPVKVGPAGVLLAFLLVYILCVWVSFLVLSIGLSWVSRLFLKKKGGLLSKEFSIGTKKAYYIATIISFVPVIFLAMRSFSELRVLDVGLVVAFVALAVFFVVKRV